MQLPFHDEQLNITAHPTLEWLMNIEDVAKGYGVQARSISKTIGRHPKEFVEGKQYLTSFGTVSPETPRKEGRPPTITHLTKRGVIRYGSFAESDRGRAFRDWAEDIIMDATRGMDSVQFFQKIEARLEQIDRTCKGFRDEIDELKDIVGIVFTDPETNQIRTLIQEVKLTLNMDGRKIVAEVKKTLDTRRIYGTGIGAQVINVLKLMLGRGIQLVDHKQEKQP